jgi:pSer/pThr/pTyr-binding forkhead associated (FHA) protein
VRCFGCAKAATIGALCDACAARLCGDTALCPEQVMSETLAGAEAALVDQWGRAHLAPPVLVVGRQPGRGGLVIAEPSVSRRHAEIRGAGREWHVLDLQSSNGTRRNGAPIAGRTALMPGDVIAFGHTSFFFVPGAPGVHTDAADRATTRPAKASYRAEDDDDGIEETFAGLRRADVALATPTGGGGGVLEIDGMTVQLTLIQFELVRVLSARMAEETAHDPRVRGFVRSSELTALLPWDTTRADDNNMKQVVRRLRRALTRAGIADIIESRHGFGYRLRVVPSGRVAR